MTIPLTLGIAVVLALLGFRGGPRTYVAMAVVGFAIAVYEYLS